MFAEPAATAVTSPELLTVALAASLLVQVSVTPLMVAPSESFTVGLSCCVLPIVAIVGAVGDNVTVTLRRPRRMVEPVPTAQTSPPDVPHTPNNVSVTPVGRDAQEVPS